MMEIELRYEILDINQIKSFLSNTNQLHKKHVSDIYLDTPNSILWKRGIYIRIRNNKKLDIKFNRECLNDLSIDRLDYCEEHSFSLPLENKNLSELNNLLISLDLKKIPSADLSDFKLANNLKNHYIIDKIRTSYSYNSFVIVVDEVEDLGTFLEIELMAENIDELASVKNSMKETLAGLKLQTIKAGYSELFLRKNNFSCYQQGRFVIK